MGRPKLFNTAQELHDCIDDYKKDLEDNDKPPTIAGLAYYTGIDRQTIYNYKAKDEYFGTISKFVKWIMMNYEEVAITQGKAGVIFLLKNYGYTDKQEIELNQKAEIEIVID